MFDGVGRALTEVGGILETPIATYAEIDAGMDVVVGCAWSGEPREAYVKAESEDQHDWVTELQQPVLPAGG